MAELGNNLREAIAEAMEETAIGVVSEIATEHLENMLGDFEDDTDGESDPGQWGSVRAQFGQPTQDMRVASHLCQTVNRKSTRLNSSHLGISYAVFCLKKK